MTEQTIHQQAHDEVSIRRTIIPEATLSEFDHLHPLADQYLEHLRRGDRQLASQLVLQAVEKGTSVKEIYLSVFLPALYEIGRLWEINQLSVAEEHYCTAATQLIMSQLYPYIFASTKNGLTMVATTLAGNLHEIGIRMVADFFEIAGWNTYYLGANTPQTDVITTLCSRKADLLAVSATLNNQVEAVQTLIDAVRRNPEARKTPVIVGGPPFIRDSELWKTVGADGTASDPQLAITLADEIMKEGWTSK